MKLHFEKPSATNVFNGYGDGFVLVNGRRIEKSVIVLPDRIIEDWGATNFESLVATHLEALADLDREVVLLGTGAVLRFPGPELMRQAKRRYAETNMGLEVMDVQAACRTYNILIAEERKVAAALLLG
mgnify:CR=1 FL=1